MLLTITVFDASNRLVAGLDQEDFQVYEDGVLQEPHELFAPAAADRAVARDRHEHEHGAEAADRARGRERIRAAARPERRRAGHRLRQPGEDSSDVHRRSRRRSSARSGGRKRAARRRSTTRSTVAERAQAHARGDADRTCGVRPSCCSPTARTRRASCPTTTCSSWPNDPKSSCTRSASSTRTRRRARAGTRRTSCCARSSRRPADAPTPSSTSSSCRRSTARSPTSSPTSTRSPTSRRTRKRDGAWRKINVQVARGGMTARTKAGYFGPKGAQ